MTEFDIDFPGEYGEDWPKRTPKRRPKSEGKALPRDADNDGFVYDGTIREMPAPIRPKRPNAAASWGWDWGGTPDRNRAARVRARRLRRAEIEAHAEDRRRDAAEVLNVDVDEEAPPVHENLRTIIQAGWKNRTPVEGLQRPRTQAARDIYNAKTSTLDSMGWRQGGIGDPHDHRSVEGGVPLPLALHGSWLAKKAVVDIVDPDGQGPADERIAAWADEKGRTYDEVKDVLLQAAKNLATPEDTRYDVRQLMEPLERRQRYGDTIEEIEAWMEERFPREGGLYYIAEDVDVEVATAIAQAVDDVLTDYPEIATMMKNLSVGNVEDGSMYSPSGQGEFGAWKLYDMEDVRHSAVINHGAHIGINVEDIYRVVDPERRTMYGQVPRSGDNTIMLTTIGIDDHDERTQRGAYAATVHEMAHVIDAHRSLAEEMVMIEGRGFTPAKDWPKERWREVLGVKLLDRHSSYDDKWGEIPLPGPGRFKEPSEYGRTGQVWEWWAESFVAWYLGMNVDINDEFLEARLATHRDFDVAEYWRENGIEFKADRRDNLDVEANLISDDFEGSLVIDYAYG